MMLLPACARTAPSTSSPPPVSDTRETRRAEIPADLRSAVDRASALGQEIYLQDKAGSIGTDTLMAAVKTLEDKGLAGFLALREGDESGRPRPSYRVLFYGTETDPLIRYEVHVPVERGKRPSLDPIDPPRRVPEPLAKLVRARQTALDVAGPFNHAMNPVVLPDPDGGILVYLLAAPTQAKTVVLGKHFRVRLTTEGIVKTVEPLSKGALELSTATSSGERHKALFVTQIVTSYPLETHVAASLAADLPLYVATERGLWSVEGGSISYVSETVPADMSRVLRH
jgi:hypothetical protein